MSSGLLGVKFTTNEVKDITGNMKSISGDIDNIMQDFNNTMGTLTGQAEGGLIDQTKTAAVQLYEGTCALANCFLDLGIKIGDYLKMMITQDSDMAQTLRDKIES